MLFDVVFDCRVPRAMGTRAPLFGFVSPVLSVYTVNQPHLCTDNIRAAHIFILTWRSPS